MKPSHTPHTITSVNLASCIVAVFSICCAGIFFVASMYQAAEKPFWLDERFALENIGRASYADMLWNGARGQGSPSPLDYLAIKFINDHESPLNPFGLRREVYLRLWANGVTCIAGLFVVGMFIREIRRSSLGNYVKLIQLLLLVLIPIAFYFQRHIYYFAAETRPYALWNSLYFVVLAMALLKDCPRWILPFSLILLSLSATMSIFQIGLLALGSAIVTLVQSKNVKTILREFGFIFFVPMLIALHYSFRSGKWGYTEEQWGTWKHFSELWFNESAIVPLMLVLIVFAFLKKENRYFAKTPMAFLGLYLIGPLIFWLTRLKGFFFTDRQYIYYDLQHGVYLLALIQVFPALVKSVSSRKLQIFFIVFVCAIGLSTGLRTKFLNKFKDSLGYTWLVWKDPSILQTKPNHGQ